MKPDLYPGQYEFWIGGKSRFYLSIFQSGRNVFIHSQVVLVDGNDNILTHSLPSVTMELLPELKHITRKSYRRIKNEMDRYE